MTDTKSTRRSAPADAVRRTALPKWAKPFHAELAASSNVSVAARKAKIATATAYDARRSNAEFNRK